MANMRARMVVHCRLSVGECQEGRMEDRLDQGAAGARRETYACLGTVGAEEEHVAVRQRRWCFPALLDRDSRLWAAFRARNGGRVRNALCGWPRQAECVECGEMMLGNFFSPIVLIAC